MVLSTDAVDTSAQARHEVERSSPCSAKARPDQGAAPCAGAGLLGCVMLRSATLGAAAWFPNAVRALHRVSLLPHRRNECVKAAAHGHHSPLLGAHLG